MLTTEELQTEIYKRHHKRIDSSDPIFMMVTMNELLLADSLEQCRAMQEAQMEEIRKNSLSVMDECEKIGTALINRSLLAMQQNYEAKEKAFIARLEQVNSDFLQKVQQPERLSHLSTFKQIGLYALLAITCFCLGVFCVQFGGFK